MPREVTTHQTQTGDINDKIRIEVLEVGRGGEPHRYLFSLGDSEGGVVAFQNGCLADGAGVNGLTNEALLAIVADRLGEFQKGELACHENGVAEYHIKTALEWLKRRTYARVNQGVEGTYVNHKQDDDKKSRVTVTDEWVHIGDRKISREALATQWKAWQNAEIAAKSLKPKLTEAEINMLSEVPTSVSGSNGFNEFKQAVNQSG